MEGLTVAKVAVENTAYSFDMLFDYSVPENLISEIFPGKRVLVPFGNSSKKRVGIIFSVIETDKFEKKLKSIVSVLDDEPLLNEEMLMTANFIRNRTFSTYFDAGKMFLPIGLSVCVNILYGVNESFCGTFETEEEKRVYEYLCQRNSFVGSDTVLSACKIKRNSDILDKMAAKNIIVRNVDAQRRIGDATLKSVRLMKEIDSNSDEYKSLTKKQQEIVKVLCDVGNASVKDICYFTGLTSAVITALANKKIIEIYDTEIYRTPKKKDSDINISKIKLSSEQEKAFYGLLNLYNEDTAKCALLYGVTGSGKTQVYLKLIDEVIKNGRGVIVMIPEISLTPQTLSLFYERYGNTVAVFHSALSLGERMDEWKRVKRGEAKIAVGTRSAVFAPFDDIGLIIMDEEQEHTYQSEMSPRYHARDVAAYRAGRRSALLLLASATPSFDTYTKAVNGTYSLFTLKKRYGKSVLPIVELIDTTYQSDMVLENISKRLAEEIKQNFEKKKQSILLLNRRGYNTFASCTECGTVMTCPNCSISLTYHIKNARLMCHYCGYSIPFTYKCSNCDNNTVKFQGSGTQRLEEELFQIVPDAKILRMDSDTTSSRYSYEDKFNQFGNGEYDIMVGTQMVAKGLDFPNVTLVGVLSVDQMLFNDDYKSGERAFDLITQVVGRSGRGDFPGKAFIQTAFTDSEIVTLAQKQDYEGFYNIELPIRREMVYPPFCDLCVIGFSGDNELKTSLAAMEFLNLFKTIHTKNFSDVNLIVLGPVVPRIGKIGGKFRYRIIIKSRNTKKFRDLIGNSLKSFAKDIKYDKINVYAQMNPENTV